MKMLLPKILNLAFKILGNSPIIPEPRHKDQIVPKLRVYTPKYTDILELLEKELVK